MKNILATFLILLLLACGGKGNIPTQAHINPIPFSNLKTTVFRIYYEGKVTTRKALYLGAGKCVIFSPPKWINLNSSIKVTETRGNISDNCTNSLSWIEVSIAPEWLNFSCFLEINNNQYGNITYYTEYRKYEHFVKTCNFHIDSNKTVNLYYRLKRE